MFWVWRRNGEVFEFSLLIMHTVTSHSAPVTACLQHYTWVLIMGMCSRPCTHSAEFPTSPSCFSFTWEQKANDGNMLKRVLWLRKGSQRRNIKGRKNMSNKIIINFPWERRNAVETQERSHGKNSRKWNVQLEVKIMVSSKSGVGLRAARLDGSISGQWESQEERRTWSPVSS